MKLQVKYNPAEVEVSGTSIGWITAFKSKPDGREPYTIVIPLPLVWACFIWDMATIPFRIFWSVVPVCREERLIDCRERIMLPLQPKRKSWIALHSEELKTDLTRVCQSMLGNGRKNTEHIIRLSSCVSWGRPVIGTITAFTMDELRSKVWSGFVVSIIKDWYIVSIPLCRWTGIPRKRWLPLSDEEVM